MNILMIFFVFLKLIIMIISIIIVASGPSLRIDSEGLEPVAAAVVLLSFDRVSSQNNNVAMKV